MHTKKTNNTNKLIQISYHSVLTKIQKLQKFKKKKKTFFCTGRYARYRPVLLEIVRYSQYEAGIAGIFSGMKQRGQAYRITGRYGTELTTLLLEPPPPTFPFATYSWDFKLNTLNTVYSSSDQSTSSTKTQGPIYNFGSLSLH